MRRVTTAVVLVLIVTVGGWAVSHHHSVEARTRRYLGMGYFDSLSSMTIEQAVLRMVPLGTPEPDVRELLSNAGIGADGLSSYSPVSYTHLRAHETPEHLVC